MNKERYEISLWEDRVVDYLLPTEHFEEFKIGIIGSDTMTAQWRAVEPRLVENINGTNTFTFKMYYKYIDIETGEKVDNPFINLLVNERKVKVNWKNKWYDLIIKSCQEDSNGKSITYTCKDQFITELSKTGFDLEFDPELKNNQGTVIELGERILYGTDWKIDTANSDIIEQTTEEPVYEIYGAQVIGTFRATDQYGGVHVIGETSGKHGTEKLLIYYSIVNNSNPFLQFVYSEDGQFVTEENEQLVIEGYYCYVDAGVNWDSDWDSSGNKRVRIVDSSIGSNATITINQAGTSMNYRADRYVRQQKQIFDPILDENVYMFENPNGKQYYQSQKTDYISPTVVVNYAANSENFISTEGWHGGGDGSILFQIYPKFENITDPVSYMAKSFLRLNSKGNYLNTGLRDNSSYFDEGIQPGESFIVRIKARVGNASSPGNSFAESLNIFTPTIAQYDLEDEKVTIKDNTFFSCSYVGIETGKDTYKYLAGGLTQTVESKWLVYKLTCKKTVLKNKHFWGSDKVGLILKTNVDSVWIEQVELFREAYGNVFVPDIDDPNKGEYQYKRINPGEAETQGIVQIKYSYYSPDDNKDVTKLEDMVFVHVGYEPWGGGTESGGALSPIFNVVKDEDGADKFEKIRSINGKNSNRYNLMQTLAETFECWVDFRIEHEKDGKLVYYKDEAKTQYIGPQKFVTFKKEVGQKIGYGFTYGVDLKTISRSIVSDQIVTKTIIPANSNEYGKNGFCTIQRSTENYPGTNFILNMDYFISQNLVDGSLLLKDLYQPANSLGYFYHLHNLNKQYFLKDEEYILKKQDLTNQEAMLDLYQKNYDAAVKEQNDLRGKIMGLISVDWWSEDDEGYPKSKPMTVMRYKKEQLDLDETEVKNEDFFAAFNSLTVAENKGENYKTFVDSLTASTIELSRYIENIDKIKDSFGVYKDFKELWENYKDKDTAEIANDSSIGIIQRMELLDQVFYNKYSRFLQEGSWISEDYIDDDLYYLDGLSVAYTSARPQISYNISVLRLSALEEFKDKIFRLGDISYIEDTEFFGYLKDGITPYKELVLISEITSNFDSPENDTFKVQNYKTQFEDLFQRITATTQSLQFASGEYNKVAGILNQDGSISSSLLQSSFNFNKDIVLSAVNDSVIMDHTGITITDVTNPNKIVRLTSAGIILSEDGGLNWRTGITGSGINTAALTAGVINVTEIFIQDGNHTAFRWDGDGLNAFWYDPIQKYTIKNRFVRFDRYGVYGIDGWGYEEKYRELNRLYVFDDDIKYFTKNGDEYTQVGHYTQVSNPIEANLENYYIKVDTEYVHPVVFRSDVNYYEKNYPKEDERYYVLATSSEVDYDPDIRAEALGFKEGEGERAIWNDAQFGMTWSGFFMKSKTNSGFIEVSSTNDIQVNKTIIEDGKITDTIPKIKIGRIFNFSSGDSIYKETKGWDLVKSTDWFLVTDPDEEEFDKYFLRFTDSNGDYYYEDENGRYYYQRANKTRFFDKSDTYFMPDMPSNKNEDDQDFFLYSETNRNYVKTWEELRPEETYYIKNESPLYGIQIFEDYLEEGVVTYRPVFSVHDDGRLWIDGTMHIESTVYDVDGEPHKNAVAIGYLDATREEIIINGETINTDIHQVFNANDNFIVYEDGRMLAQAGYFQGEIIAESGKIGPFTVTADTMFYSFDGGEILFSPEGLNIIGSGLTIQKATPIKVWVEVPSSQQNEDDFDKYYLQEFDPNTGEVTYIKPESYNPNLNYWMQIDDFEYEPVFNFDSETQEMYVKGNGEFTGTIRAEAGDIGGFIITETELYSEDGGVRLVGGNPELGIPGQIIAEAGTIGGFIIAEDKLYSENGYLTLYGIEGKIDADFIDLGTGAYIKKYIQIGENVRLNNPDVTDGRVLIVYNNDAKNIVDLTDKFIKPNKIQADSTHPPIIMGYYEVDDNGYFVKTEDNSIERKEVDLSNITNPNPYVAQLYEFYNNGTESIDDDYYQLTLDTEVDPNKKYYELNYYEDIYPDSKLYIWDVDNSIYVPITNDKYPSSETWYKDNEGENASIEITKTGQINLSNNIILNGAAPYPYIKGRNWYIREQKAAFKNVEVSGVLRATTFEYGRIQTASGAIMFRPSSNFSPERDEYGNSIISFIYEEVSNEDLVGINPLETGYYELNNENQEYIPTLDETIIPNKKYYKRAKASARIRLDIDCGINKGDYITFLKEGQLFSDYLIYEVTEVETELIKNPIGTDDEANINLPDVVQAILTVETVSGTTEDLEEKINNCDLIVSYASQDEYGAITNNLMIGINSQDSAAGPLYSRAMTYSEIGITDYLEVLSPNTQEYQAGLYYTYDKEKDEYILVPEELLNQHPDLDEVYYKHQKGYDWTEEKPKVLVGDLTPLSGIYGEYDGKYGFYSNQAYLSGALTNETGEGTYAGISTILRKQSKALYERFGDESSVIFFAGASYDELMRGSSNYFDCAFQVTESGRIYGQQAYITNSLITDTAVETDVIKTSKLMNIIYHSPDDGSIYNHSLEFYSTAAEKGIQFLEEPVYQQVTGTEYVLVKNIIDGISPIKAQYYELLNGEYILTIDTALAEDKQYYEKTTFRSEFDPREVYFIRYDNGTYEPAYLKDSFEEGISYYKLDSKLTFAIQKQGLTYDKDGERKTIIELPNQEFDGLTIISDRLVTRELSFPYIEILEAKSLNFKVDAELVYYENRIYEKAYDHEENNYIFGGALYFNDDGFTFSIDGSDTNPEGLFSDETIIMRYIRGDELAVETDFHAKEDISFGNVMNYKKIYHSEEKTKPIGYDLYVNEK